MLVSRCGTSRNDTIECLTLPVLIGGTECGVGGKVSIPISRKQRPLIITASVGTSSDLGFFTGVYRSLYLRFVPLYGESR